MVNFTAPPAGTVQMAPLTNPATAIVKSIVGVFIGILIILFLAPTVLWFAENQNIAKIFSFSKEVASTSGVSGFIRVMDTAKADSSLVCYQNKVGGDCIYYNYKLEELQYTLKDYCGSLKKNQQVIETKGQQCSRDNNDKEKCKQCYLVNESDWKVIQQENVFQSFSIGNFKIPYPNNAKIIGSGRYNKQIDASHKESMSYFKDNTRLLVSGSSDGSTISHGGKKKYLLISSMDYQSTYETLKAQDKITGWVLRILTFVILLIGYNLLFGPISVMSDFARKIPFIGKWIGNAVGGIIFLVSLFLAILHFIILWILITIIKNIILIAVLVAGIIGIFYLYTYFKKSR